MQIMTEAFGDVLVTHTPDEMTEPNVAAFRAAFERAIAEGRAKFVVHMDRTDSLDSAALSCLLDLRDEVRAAGGQAKICGLTATGAKIFRLTRLDRSFELFDSLIDAVGSFR